MKKILIAYITKTNTTKEYAEHIKKGLEGEEVKVDLLRLEQVNNLKNYDAVIIGSPINGMMWTPDASNFVKEHVDELSKVTTAYYFVSYMYHDGRPMWHNAIDKSMAKVSNMVKPVIIGKFSGKVDRKFPRFFAWVFGIKKDTALNLVNLKLADKFVVDFKKYL